MMYRYSSVLLVIIPCFRFHYFSGQISGCDVTYFKHVRHISFKKCQIDKLTSRITSEIFSLYTWIIFFYNVSLQIHILSSQPLCATQDLDEMCFASDVLEMCQENDPFTYRKSSGFFEQIQRVSQKACLLPAAVQLFCGSFIENVA